MADWYGSARSNYFRVKDKTKFQDWVDTVPDLVAEFSENGVAMISSEDEYGGWPTRRCNEESDEYEDIDLLEELWPHLAKGEVAVLVEVGAEKLRCLTGVAQAVGWRGKRVELSLEAIYAMAACEFSVRQDRITRASY